MRSRVSDKSLRALVSSLITFEDSQHPASSDHATDRQMVRPQPADDVKKQKKNGF